MQILERTTAPAGVLPDRERWTLLAPVVGVQEGPARHVRLHLWAPQIADSAKAGQFAHLLGRSFHSYDPLLRRAFSIMDVQDEKISFLFRIEGRATAELARLRAGDRVNLLGPLGNGFDISAHTGRVKPQGTQNCLVSCETKEEAAHCHAVVVGGGVGVPPLLFLVKQLIRAGQSAAAITAIFGARHGSDLLGVGEMENLGVTVQPMTEDGSIGEAGRVTDALQLLLLKMQSRMGRIETSMPLVYACGPFPMLRAVAKLCADFEAPCQVSLEENMPCGVGVCNGCVVRMRPPQVLSLQLTPREGGEALAISQMPVEWTDYDYYRRICVDGPVLWAHEVDWEFYR